MSTDDVAIFNRDAVCTVDRTVVEELAERTLRLGRSCRLCLHRSHSDGVQEMIIAHARGTYVRPHRHGQRSVSYHMIAGAISFVLFDGDGLPDREIVLSEPGSRHPFALRLCDNSWYMPSALTEIAIFHETITGPFQADGFTEWAPWSPESTDQSDGASFAKRARSALERKGKP